jgi:Tfp pilus assembly protein PilX
MLMTLMILMVIGLLGAAIIELGMMELKISNYEFRAKQAQHAADAGVDWGAERIYLQLVSRQDETELPMLIDLQPDMNPQRIGQDLSDSRAPNFVIRDWRANRVSSVTSNPVVYRLISTGNFGNAYKKITVELSYKYNGGIIDPITDNFMERDYSGCRGGISSYVVP